MSKHTITGPHIAFSLAVLFALIFGISAGAAIAGTKNNKNSEEYFSLDPELPTRLFDVEDRLIREFSAAGKRELISVKDLPPHFVNALITREDDTFFTHPGFTLKSIFRAVWGQLTNQNLGGGSTITQQIAGELYADRHEYSIKRKLVELWYALQMERRFSKQEILEMYLNRVYLGSGCYGVEAASKFYFGHSARDISLAESAVLVVQLSNPANFNPIEKPNEAMDRSRAVLNEMVDHGFCTQEAADESFAFLWDNFDFTRESSSAFFTSGQDDKAPWFSEFVRRELDNRLYGSLNYFDGLTVKTTLDLDDQAVAARLMSQSIDKLNKEFSEANAGQNKIASRLYAPVAEMLGLAFNITPIFSYEAKIKGRTFDRYFNNIQPAVDALSLIFDMGDLKTLIDQGYKYTNTEVEKTKVEGALITINNDNGHIVALIGGSKFGQTNNNIRATQSYLQPGSAFKPFMYSAAMDTKRMTQATQLYDAPIVFYNSDGTPYLPNNYGNVWRGPVLLWYAVAMSLNIPAIKTLDEIGFDATINRAASLLRITDPDEKRRSFPRVYPLALGIVGVSPLKMALGYSAFANGGREIEPVCIISVEDRDGRIVLEPEKESMMHLKEKGSAAQLITPENAFIMTDILKKTCSAGTLFRATEGGKRLTYTDNSGAKYTIPVAGKTGTTQNWADAWAMGLTPYYTTAIWFGFDRSGNSLGSSQSGAAIAGYVWGEYAYETHKDLPFKDFPKAPAGIYQATVCRISGKTPGKYCNEGTITLNFMPGSGPGGLCDSHNASGRVADPDQPFIKVDTTRLDGTSAESGSSETAPASHNPNLGKLPSAPANPVTNDWYYNTGDFSFYRWNGKEWEFQVDTDDDGTPDM